MKRMRQHSLILAVQDTTFFNYTHHPQTAGLGEIGNKQQKQRGFGMHSTLAVTPAGVPLGLLTQSFFTRPSLPDTFCEGHVKGDRDGQMLV